MGQCNSTIDLTKQKAFEKVQNRIEFSQKMLVTSYRDDETIQKKISKVKIPPKGKVRALDSPWRERINAFSLDENDLLYREDRLVIPKTLQSPINISLH